MSNDGEKHRCLWLSHSRGDFVRGDDGYYVYWPTSEANRGSLAAHHLRWLAEELDSLNAAWDAIVQNDPRIAG